MSTGTIYHHLDTLSPLIKQEKDKKYYLTELGHHAYDSLKNNIENIISPEFSTREFESPILKGLMFLTPKKLISYQNYRLSFTVILTVFILILGLIFSNLNDLLPFFLLFIDLSQLTSSPSVIWEIILSSFFIVNFLLYYGINEFICRLFYKKNENTLKFLSSFSFTFTPVIIYLMLRYIFKELDLLEFSAINILDNILMIIFQVWALWILTFNLIVNKNLKIESALIISLIIHYGSFSIILAVAI